MLLQTLFHQQTTIKKPAFTSPPLFEGGLGGDFGAVQSNSAKILNGCKYLIKAHFENLFFSKFECCKARHFLNYCHQVPAQFAQFAH